jgi:hypothetical protein
MIRDLVFVDEGGESGRHASLTAADMGTDAFCTFCLANGNYIWKGKKEDLQILWQENFLNDDGRHIVEPDHVGYIEKEKMWLFGNVAITADGKEMRPDESGIFWTDKRGYKPIPIGVTSGGQAISEGIPYLSTNDSVDIKEIRANLADTIGNIEADKCLAWVTAVAFSSEAFKQFGCFPFLFMNGKTTSGKSTISEWMCSFFGIENNGLILSDTTPVAIMRSLGYYSGLPVFLDEYRNDEKIIQKTQFLRNVYNRQSAGKGIKADFGLRMAKVRGTVIIAGEELPKDVAIINRSIVIPVIRAKKRQDHYEWFCREKGKFSRFFYELLINKKNLVPKFNSMLIEAKQVFTSQKIDERTAINFSIICAGYVCAFGESKEFAKLIVEDIKKVHESNKEAGMVGQFIQDVLAMKYAQKFKNVQYWEVKGDELHIYIQALWNLWQEDSQRRGDKQLSVKSLRDCLREEPGWVSHGSVSRINGELAKVTVFKIKDMSADMSSFIEDSLFNTVTQ